MGLLPHDLELPVGHKATVMPNTWVRRIVTRAEHVPDRADWRCRTCRREWPCPRRRASVVRRSCGSTLSMTLEMSGYLGQAHEDMPDVSRSVLWRRFLGWAR